MYLNLDNWNLRADDSILYIKVDIKRLNLLERSLSPVCFIVKKCFATEDMSA